MRGRIGAFLGVIVSSMLTGAGVLAEEGPSGNDHNVNAGQPPDDAATEDSRWCAEELLALSEGVCAVVPETLADPPTVVVFLHGVIQPGSNWQWAQQRALARGAARHGFVGVMPRGRRGHGPKGMEDWWTWPTNAAGQQAFESEVLTEWTMAERALEGALGKAFEARYVFGFSNGAYYASSLALRGRFAADGFGIFAGGSGAPYLAKAAKGVTERPPIYVGYGHRDGPAKRDARELGATLAALHWPSRVVGRPGVGHSMTDSMIEEALEFFR